MKGNTEMSAFFKLIATGPVSDTNVGDRRGVSSGKEVHLTAMSRLARASAVALAGIVLAAGLDVATYPRWRRWCLTWGTVADEASLPLPGDNLLPTPDLVSTRAIHIDAPPSLIWPWLVQMGPGRGGAYTYDWIENLLGLNMHSADAVLPEYQGLKVGDVQRLGTGGTVLRVEMLEPERALVLHSEDGNWAWAFALIPVEGGTRLISRNRIALPTPGPTARALYTYLMEPGSLIMERKMLLGIKERVERPSRSSEQPMV